MLYLLKTLDNRYIYIYIYLDEQFLFKHLKSGAACVTIPDMNTSTTLLISVPWYQVLEGHHGKSSHGGWNLSPEAERQDRGESCTALGVLVVVTERPQTLDRNTRGSRFYSVYYIQPCLGGSQVYKIPKSTWLNCFTNGLVVQYCCASNIMLCLHAYHVTCIVSANSPSSVFSEQAADTLLCCSLWSNG